MTEAASARRRELASAAEIVEKSTQRMTLALQLPRLARAGTDGSEATATSPHSRVPVALAFRTDPAAATALCDFPTTTVRQARPPPRATPGRRGGGRGRCAAAAR